jgi:hypothetical protein
VRISLGVNRNIFIQHGLTSRTFGDAKTKSYISCFPLGYLVELHPGESTATLAFKNCSTDQCLETALTRKRARKDGIQPPRRANHDPE